MGKGKIMEKRKLKISTLILFLLSLYNALKADLASQKKLLLYFDEIEVNGNIDVFLNKGKRFREAQIYADSEIINSVIVKVSKRTLFIDANNTYNIARRLPFIRLQAERKFPVEIIVSIESIKGIRLLGKSNLTGQDFVSDNLSIFMASSGKLHLQNILTPKVDIIHEGTGNIVLKGNDVENLNAKITQNGSLFADELQVEKATLVHQGKGTVHLNPLKWMDARILGDGNLFLYEKPENIVIDQRGRGRVSDILPDAKPLYELNQSIP